MSSVVWLHIYPVLIGMCTVHTAECDYVYSPLCRMRLCVQCIVRLCAQCTVQSETVYTVQCETVCTVQSAE